MAKKILWFDNDPDYLMPYIEALQDEGYDVTTARTVTEAERFVNAGQYDLLILDVMIPTRNVEEEVTYTAEETELGYKTGLLFYRRMKGKLEKAGMQVLTVTVRLDQSIVDEFMKAGLPRNNITTKFDCRDAVEFINKVKMLLGEL